MHPHIGRAGATRPCRQWQPARKPRTLCRAHVAPLLPHAGPFALQRGLHPAPSCPALYPSPTAHASPARGTLSCSETQPPHAVRAQVLDVLPGVSGGVARVMVGQPFDTIKTRLQVGAAKALKHHPLFAGHAVPRPAGPCAMWCAASQRRPPPCRPPPPYRLRGVQPAVGAPSAVPASANPPSRPRAHPNVRAVFLPLPRPR